MVYVYMQTAAFRPYLCKGSTLHCIVDGLVQQAQLLEQGSTLLPAQGDGPGIGDLRGYEPTGQANR